MEGALAIRPFLALRDTLRSLQAGLRAFES